MRRNVTVGVAHIKATFNNTTITITDTKGDVLCWASAGTSGFKGSRKSTPFAGQMSAQQVADKAIKCGMKETQNAALYSRVKNALAEVLTDDAIVLSFGWNTMGMGKGRGFEPIEYMICDHGAAHNATLCLAEKRKLSA